VDLSGTRPRAKLKIKYTHQGGQRDWFLDELNKTVFGNWIEIPIGQEKIIEFAYLLPERIKEGSEYRILVQKQSGIDSFPFKLILKNIYQKEFEIDRDLEICL